MTNATIHEAGNGFPEVGDIVWVDGTAYDVVELEGRITVHGPGVGNSVRALVEETDSDDDGHPCTVVVD